MITIDLVCESCGETNPPGTEFCTNCNNFLAWDRSVLVRPPGNNARPVSPVPPAPPTPAPPTNYPTPAAPAGANDWTAQGPAAGYPEAAIRPADLSPERRATPTRAMPTRGTPTRGMPTRATTTQGYYEGGYYQGGGGRARRRWNRARTSIRPARPAAGSTPVPDASAPVAATASSPSRRPTRTPMRDRGGRSEAAQDRAARREYRRSLPPLYRWRRVIIGVLVLVLAGRRSWPCGAIRSGWCKDGWYALTKASIVTVAPVRARSCRLRPPRPSPTRPPWSMGR